MSTTNCTFSTLGRPEMLLKRGVIEIRRPESINLPLPQPGHDPVAACLPSGRQRETLPFPVGATGFEPVTSAV